MNKQEFASWQALTESSSDLWTEDDIFRLNDRGAFFYRGGENGQYIRIQKDGLLEAGTYEGAVPHIGEAIFRPVVTRQCKDFLGAAALAIELGGKRFLIDMFRSFDHTQAVDASNQAYLEQEEGPTMSM